MRLTKNMVLSDRPARRWQLLDLVADSVLDVMGELRRQGDRGYLPGVRGNRRVLAHYLAALGAATAFAWRVTAPGARCVLCGRAVTNATALVGDEGVVCGDRCLRLAPWRKSRAFRVGHATAALLVWRKVGAA